MPICFQIICYRISRTNWFQDCTEVLSYVTIKCRWMGEKLGKFQNRCTGLAIGQGPPPTFGLGPVLRFVQNRWVIFEGGEIVCRRMHAWNSKTQEPFLVVGPENADASILDLAAPLGLASKFINTALSEIFKLITFYMACVTIWYDDKIESLLLWSA